MSVTFGTSNGGEPTRRRRKKINIFAVKEDGGDAEYVWAVNHGQGTGAQRY
jgi:hypothetical protein